LKENAEVLASSVRAESTKRGPSVLKVFEGMVLERLCRDGAWTFVEKESVPLSTLVMTSDEFQETWSNFLYVARQDALQTASQAVEYSGIQVAYCWKHTCTRHGSGNTFTGVVIPCCL
jgi:hypothetical protein